MAIGVDMTGPGSFGDKVSEPSLVLASNFASWLSRLEEDDWVEYGIVPGSIAELQPERQGKLRAHFLSINPKITWGKEVG